MLPYLHDLGVDWVYLSPLLAAEPGSDHGYDVVDHDRIDPARGGRRGPGRAVGRGARGSAWACSSTSCPTTSGVATPGRERVVVGRADARPRVRRTPRASTSTGPPAADGCASRCVGDDDLLDDGLDRQPAWSRPASCATTTTLPARSRQRRRRRSGPPTPCTPGSTTSWSPGGGRRRPQLPPVLRRQHPGGDPGRGPRVFDRSHAEIGRWFDEGLVDGLRVDHPDGLRDPGGTSTTSPS